MASPRCGGHRSPGLQQIREYQLHRFEEKRRAPDAVMLAMFEEYKSGGRTQPEPPFGSTRTNCAFGWP